MVGGKELAECKRDQKKEIVETHGSQLLYGLDSKLAKLSVTLICVHTQRYLPPYHSATHYIIRRYLDHACIHPGGPKIQVLPWTDYSGEYTQTGEEDIGL